MNGSARSALDRSDAFFAEPRSSINETIVLRVAKKQPRIVREHEFAEARNQVQQPQSRLAG